MQENCRKEQLLLHLDLASPPLTLPTGTLTAAAFSAEEQTKFYGVGNSYGLQRNVLARCRVEPLEPLDVALGVVGVHRVLGAHGLHLGADGAEGRRLRDSTGGHAQRELRRTCRDQSARLQVGAQRLQVLQVDIASFEFRVPAYLAIAPGIAGRGLLSLGSQHAIALSRQRQGSRQGQALEGDDD